MQNQITYLIALVVKEDANHVYAYMSSKRFIKAMYLRIFICISLSIKLVYIQITILLTNHLYLKANNNNNFLKGLYMQNTFFFSFSI